jgi:hypothetical protein
MNPNEKRIDDLIVENLEASKNAVMAAFNTKSVEDLVGWERLLASMRSLPEEAMQDVGVPLVQKCFMVFGCDPTTKNGRSKMHGFQDVVALALQDCMTIMMQNMQRSQQVSQALRAGKSGLLR